MSTSTDPGSDVTIQNLLASLARSYRQLDLGLRGYLLRVLLPTVAFCVVVVVGTIVFRPSLLIGAPLVGLSVFGIITALIFPKLKSDRQRNRIRERFHLFLTHITVLSMTNTNRVDIFRTLAREEEYGGISQEMGQVVALVDTWNQSLDDACRMRSREVVSPLLADFLERLSYTISAGQGINEFLVGEQDTFIEKFVVRYRNDLAKLDVMKELYLSLIMSTVFILVFAILMPFLIGVNPTLILGGVIGLFGVVQTGFLFVVHSIAPADPVWYMSSTEGNSPMGRIRLLLVVSFLGMIPLLGIIAALLTGQVPQVVARYTADLPVVVYPAVVMTPLVLPGIVMRRNERRVKERDEEFPAFIRALGSVQSIKQTSTSNVLESLRRKDFGELTPIIDNLYKRLQIRIDARRAWRSFAGESGSNLIQKFGEMYVVGRRTGGDPEDLGQIISQNMNEVLKVRERRRQTARTLIGVIYGITVASVFALFVGLEIIEMMISISEGLQTQAEQPEFGTLLYTAGYNLDVIGVLITIVLMINALLSSLMIRVIDRGHFVTGLLHYVSLMWLSALTATVTKVAVSGLVSVG